MSIWLNMSVCQYNTLIVVYASSEFNISIKGTVSSHRITTLSAESERKLEYVMTSWYACACVLACMLD